jgi:TolA-binding protein
LLTAVKRKKTGKCPCFPFDFEKYAHRYLGEFQYRFNRRFDLAGMFKRLVKATANADKVPEQKLRLAED